MPIIGRWPRFASGRRLHAAASIVAASIVAVSIVAGAGGCRSEAGASRSAQIATYQPVPSDRRQSVLPTAAVPPPVSAAAYLAAAPTLTAAPPPAAARRSVRGANRTGARSVGRGSAAPQSVAGGDGPGLAGGRRALSASRFARRSQAVSGDGAGHFRRPDARCRLDDRGLAKDSLGGQAAVARPPRSRRGVRRPRRCGRRRIGIGRSDEARLSGLLSGAARSGAECR